MDESGIFKWEPEDEVLLHASEGDIMSGEEDDNVAVHVIDADKLRLTLPTFAGEGTVEEISEDYLNFTENFTAYVRAKKLTEDQALAVIRGCFKPKSPAERWFNSTTRNPKHDITTLDQLVPLMDRRFRVPKTAIQLAIRRDLLHQTKTEGVRAFADRVQVYQLDVDLLRRTRGIPDLTAAQTAAAVNRLSDLDAQVLYLQGLNTEVRAILQTQELAENMDDIVQQAVRAEQALTEKKAPTVTSLLREPDGAAAVDSRPQKKKWPPTQRPKWINLKKHLPTGICYTCAWRGHSSDNCHTPYERQRWQQLIKELNLRPPPPRNAVNNLEEQVPVPTYAAAAAPATAPAQYVPAPTVMVGQAVPNTAVMAPMVPQPGTPQALQQHVIDAHNFPTLQQQSRFADF